MQEDFAAQHYEVVVIGAGFAGIQVIKAMAQLNRPVLLIDRNSHHTFVPLLYQVATGIIPAKTIAYPIRELVKGVLNVRLHIGNVTEINLERNRIWVDQHCIIFEHLVIATGSRPGYLGVPGARENALSLGTIEDALDIRRQILSVWESLLKAETMDRQQLRSLLTFVIVGGGATGVELAGAIVENLKHLRARAGLDSIQGIEPRVVLLQADARLLPAFPEDLSSYTSDQLRRRGIQVQCKARVTEVKPGEVTYTRGDKIGVVRAQTVLWTAGVEPATPPLRRDSCRWNGQKLAVDSALRLEGYENIYAIGDVSHIIEFHQHQLDIAPEAIQQGVATGQNILRHVQGKPLKPFRYLNKGSAAIIARYSGVANLFGRVHFKGPAAWVLWLAIHCFYLPGWRNRFILLKSWIRDLSGNDAAR